jgi:ferredoxin
MREVVLEQCYSQPLAPRSRTVYYHYFEVVPNALPGSPVVRRTALLTEDMVEGFMRSHQGQLDAGLKRADFIFDETAAHGLPSTVPVQSTARAVTVAHTAQVAATASSSLPFQEEENDDDCTLCGGARGGFLISCSFCVRSFHFDCLDAESLLSLTVEPSGDAWACPRKVCKVPSLPTTQAQLTPAWA